MPRNNKKRDDQEEPSSPAWMVTYGDMMTLLLCFFVLIISFSNIDEIRFSLSMRALQGALGIMPRMSRVLETEKPWMMDTEIVEKMKLTENMEELNRLAKALGFQEEMTYELSEGTMLIRLRSKVLFGLGSSNLRREAFDILTALGNTIKEHNVKNVIIGGHTDNLPISTAEFPSNWELSTARALSVVKFMIDSVNVAPGKLVAAGYSQYQPIRANDTPEHRAENRRVEFLINW